MFFHGPQHGGGGETLTFKGEQFKLVRLLATEPEKAVPPVVATCTTTFHLQLRRASVSLGY